MTGQLVLQYGIRFYIDLLGTNRGPLEWVYGRGEKRDQIHSFYGTIVHVRSTWGI